MANIPPALDDLVEIAHLKTLRTEAVPDHADHFFAPTNGDYDPAFIAALKPSKKMQIQDYGTPPMIAAASLEKPTQLWREYHLGDDDSSPISTPETPVFPLTPDTIDASLCPIYEQQADRGQEYVFDSEVGQWFSTLDLQSKNASTSSVGVAQGMMQGNSPSAQSISGEAFVQPPEPESHPYIFHDPYQEPTGAPAPAGLTWEDQLFQCDLTFSVIPLSTHDSFPQQSMLQHHHQSPHSQTVNSGNSGQLSLSPIPSISAASFASPNSQNAPTYHMTVDSPSSSRAPARPSQRRSAHPYLRTSTVEHQVRHHPRNSLTENPVNDGLLSHITSISVTGLLCPNPQPNYSSGSSQASTSSTQGASTPPSDDSKPPSSAKRSVKPVTKRVARTSRGFPCTVPGCQKTFGRKGDMERHLRAVQHTPTGHSLRTLECPKCGKPFARRDSLNRHISKAACFKRREPGLKFIEECID